jgi:hypothetical protein
MAESLSSERQGANGGDRAGFLGFVEKHAEIETELVDAKETVRSINRRRKDLRKLIANEGHDIDEFDRALKDAARSGAEREAADNIYRRNMEWLGKPVGHQTALDLAGAAPAPMQWSVHDLKRVDREGFDAGKAGERADRNSYSPGTEAFARWHSSWLRGQAEKVEKEIKPTADAPKRRGRPPGSKNAAKANGDTAPQNDIARAAGKADGLAGNRDHAARYAAGENGHGDYELGHAEGQRERPVEGETAPAAPNGADHDTEIDGRLLTLAIRLDAETPSRAVSIIGAAEALGADEEAIKVALNRLVAEGKIQTNGAGIWYPPAP